MSEETRVYIAQLKCPQNHCVLAAGGEFDSAAAAAVLGYRLGFMMGGLVAAKKLDHKCGICNSTDLFVTVDATRFRTIAEAAPFLRQSEADQQASAEWLKRSRQ